MASLKDRIKEILLRDKLIDPEKLDQAIAEQKTSKEELTKILIRLKLIDENTLAQVLSEGLGLPTISLSRLSIDPAVIELIPKEIALKYKVLPISILGETLTLSMVDPMNVFVIDNIKTITGFTINPIISRGKDIEDALEKYYEEDQAQSGKSTETFDDIMQDMKDVDDLEIVKEIQVSSAKGFVEEIKDQAPMIKLVDTIIQQAVLAKASDVFIEPLESSMRVRYRVDGVIREIDRMAKVLHAPIISRIKVVSNLDISEHRLPQDGRFKTIISGDREVDFRVNVLPTIIGEKIVLRILDQGGTVLDIDQLGFEKKALERLKECSLKPHGMILTCGPTGSGKTTTLYSILHHVDSPEKNITTVEDPVEYQMDGANQVNVKPNLGLTFPICLRSILRQDPDIILIGEIRDSETLDIAVKAALTGHLVLSSLHTTTAAGSVIRMMNMGIEPFLICSSVLAIVAQRLIRKICEHCKEPYSLTPAIAKKLRLDSNKKIQLFKGKGCKKCLRSGYQGRLGITEIIIMSPKIRELILNCEGEIKIKEAARKEGMQTMREDGLSKAFAGLTTIEEVLRVTSLDDPKKE